MQLQILLQILQKQYDNQMQVSTNDSCNSVYIKVELKQEALEVKFWKCGRMQHSGVRNEKKQFSLLTVVAAGEKIIG